MISQEDLWLVPIFSGGLKTASYHSCYQHKRSRLVHLEEFHILRREVQITLQHDLLGHDARHRV